MELLADIFYHLLHRTACDLTFFDLAGPPVYHLVPPRFCVGINCSVKAGY